MRYNGDVWEMMETAQAKEYVDAVKKKLPKFGQHITLMVEGRHVVILKNIGYNQYQIEEIMMDMRSKK